jgi:hypothetical protein
MEILSASDQSRNIKNAPYVIEFHVANQRDFARHSDNETIRFHVERRAGKTVIDGDWCSTRFELSRSVARQIESAWNSESVAYPCKRGECGGGKACLKVAIAPERENFWREFLRELLTRPEAWIALDGRGPFIPAPIEAIA